MKTIIVDDEPLAREILENYIKKTDGMELVGQCSNTQEAEHLLLQEDIQLILLDTQMPGKTGVDFLMKLKNPPAIIFTTAHSQYALAGYELDIVDYLLKPISYERFKKAIEKLKLKNLPSVEKSKMDAEYIYVKSDKKLIRLSYTSIYYIEGLKDYVIIHTPEGRILTLQTMKSLEDRLPDRIFTRIHRSYIINNEHIESIYPNSVVLMKKELPIGKNYKEGIFTKINHKKI